MNTNAVLDAIAVRNAIAVRDAIAAAAQVVIDNLKRMSPADHHGDKSTPAGGAIAAMEQVIANMPDTVDAMNEVRYAMIATNQYSANGFEDPETKSAVIVAIASSLASSPVVEPEPEPEPEPEVDPIRVGFLGEITTMCSDIQVGCVIQPRDNGTGWWVEVDCAYWQDVAKVRETARRRGYLTTEHGTKTWFYAGTPEGLL